MTDRKKTKAQLLDEVARLRQQVKDLHADIAAPEKAKERLQQGREITEASKRAESEFLAIISHELRTPLDVILGYTDLLLEGSFGRLREEQIHPLRRIHSYTWELSALITAVLDVSRLEAGRLPVTISEVQIPLMLQELAAETQETYQRSGLHFRWEVEGKLAPIRTDPEKLKVVLRNLLGNAVKFTPQGGITVRAAAKREGVEVRISDSGIGIPPQALGLIFEPFHQVEHSATPHPGGIGLGLYIVKQMLNVLGGTITVESEVGRGSTFFVWVPQGKKPQKARRRARPG